MCLVLREVDSLVDDEGRHGDRRDDLERRDAERMHSNVKANVHGSMQTSKCARHYVNGGHLHNSVPTYGPHGVLRCAHTSKIDVCKNDLSTIS